MPVSQPDPLPPDSEIPVAILGATGAVGQRLIEALEGHPWFTLAEPVASARPARRTRGMSRRPAPSLVKGERDALPLCRVTGQARRV